MSRFTPLAVGVMAVVLVAGAPPQPSFGAERAEVVVLLDAPALAHAPGTAARIDGEQRAFRRALATAIPQAHVGWRYRLVANGLSVTLPAAQISRLEQLAHVRDVLAAESYAPTLSSTPQQIGAPALWGARLDTAGQGMKIGIIDSGIDPDHSFFDPTGYTMPAGFPKGQRRFTTAKVIVARVFAPRNAPEESARVAYADEESSHGTHVAGIAAGNADTPAQGRRITGVAPRAYLGNYKVFIATSAGLSPNANSPAIVAAIEAAVADGMDVINFSGGEPEIEPSRDIVALAIDAAAAAGVVPVVAAGNDYAELGAGSVSSPANSARAISVGAAEITSTGRRHAEFSSVGPTTISLRLKPDVSAPGVDVLSSVSGGDFASFSGTSMAAPHVAGAAALLQQRHPAWTVEQVKSALVQSGADLTDERSGILGPQFQGGGVTTLGRADRPLLFSEPTLLSFGLLARRSRLSGAVQLTDAGEGAGSWQIGKTHARGSTGRAALVLPSAVTVPGTLRYEVVVPAGARAGDVTGFIELRRGADERRIPFWGRVATPSLGRHQVRTLGRTGVYRSTTAGRPALVTRYRYPETPSGVGLTTTLRGPERVFRFRISSRVANAGVVVTQLDSRARVEPRIVTGLDENRLTGYAGLPVNHNPYMDTFREPLLAAAVLSPVRGDYAVVFDSAERAGAGEFRFRLWVNDVTPPTLRLRTRSVVAGGPVQVSATDAGSGVYPASLLVTVDGRRVKASVGRGVVSIPTGALDPGPHRLRVRLSDFQESKNTENVARILPNTRWLTATFRVR